MAQPGLLLDDRYRLDEHIAAGGMGEVWRGTDLLLNRRIAVKLMRPHYAQDEEGLARFRAEARYAASLQHPNIAVVYDYWEGDPPGQPYLVMELVNGPSLAGLVEQGPMPPGPVMDVVAQTAAGLQAAHTAGLVHRDIKPGNLLIGPGGQVKITDFGIARAESSAALTSTGLVVGTIAYLAPERLHGTAATPAADLYALGMVAHECLTGRRPFDGEPIAIAYAHQQGKLPPLPPSVPPDVAGLVAALAAKDPEARPASAGQVAEWAGQLRAALTGSAASYQDSPAYAGGPATAGTSPTGDYFPATQTGRATWPGPARTGGGGPVSGGVTAADLPGPPRRRFPLRAVLLGGGLAVACLVAVLLMVLPGSAPQHGSARLRSNQHPVAPASPSASPTAGTVSAGVPQQPAPTVAPVASPTLTPTASPSMTVTPTATATAPTGAPTSSAPAPTPTAGTASP